MILTCPECSTRYSINDEAVGANGRTVRCSKCHATWFVAAEPDTLYLTDIENEIRSDMIKESKPPTEFESRLSPEPDQPTVGAHVQIRDRVEQQRWNRRFFSVSMIWVCTLAALVTAALLGYLFRQDIVERSPATASIYKVFGIPVKVDGLDFEKPVTRSLYVDGQPALVVNGNIVNKSSRTQSVPMIELSLASNTGEVLASWLVEPSQQTLLPKQRLEYVSQYLNPPIDAANLEYRFIKDVDQPFQLLPDPSNEEQNLDELDTQ